MPGSTVPGRSAEKTAPLATWPAAGIARADSGHARKVRPASPNVATCVSPAMPLALLSDLGSAPAPLCRIPGDETVRPGLIAMGQVRASGADRDQRDLRPARAPASPPVVRIHRPETRGGTDVHDYGLARRAVLPAPSRQPPRCPEAERKRSRDARIARDRKGTLEVPGGHASVANLSGATATAELTPDHRSNGCVPPLVEPGQPGEVIEHHLKRICVPRSQAS